MTGINSKADLSEFCIFRYPSLCGTTLTVHVFGGRCGLDLEAVVIQGYASIRLGLIVLVIVLMCVDISCSRGRMIGKMPLASPRYALRWSWLVNDVSAVLLHFPVVTSSSQDCSFWSSVSKIEPARGSLRRAHCSCREARGQNPL